MQPLTVEMIERD